MALLAAGETSFWSARGRSVLGPAAGGRPLTLESALYGLAAACLLGAVVLWFASWQAVLTADKITYLFGRIAPALALLLSLTLSFVPRCAAGWRRRTGPSGACWVSPGGAWTRWAGARPCSPVCWAGAWRTP